MSATDLMPMLDARSIALVGASIKEYSLGWQMTTELLRGGFDGQIHPVNPGYEEVLDLPCVPTIADIPGGPVDLAILGVANHRVERALADAIAAGARSVVTFSSLHEEEPPAPGASPLADRLAAMAADAGIPLCGGNCMGFCNLESGLRATGFPTPDNMRPGPVAFVSHSGSAFAAMAFNDRRIGFNLLVSSGQEIVTTMDEYMTYALELETTRVLALLLETVRDPEGFRAALRLAQERDVPVVALKVGRTEGAKAMVTAHSGALAGEHGAFEALFEAHGVHEVRSLEEMADAMELFASPRRVTRGRGIASVHDSGGERALFVDLAADLGVPFAKISPETCERIQAVLDPGLVAENPLDAWGTGIDADRIFNEAFALLAEDPETAANVFVVDLTEQGEPYDEGYLAVARDTWEATDAPFCVLSNLPSAIAPAEGTWLREQGIPVLEGTESGLRALGHLLADGERREQEAEASEAPESPADDVRERWRRRLQIGGLVGEQEGLALLADYGIPVVPSAVVASVDEAAAEAERLGFPVVLKTATPGIEHKSDVGGVKLGLADADAVREAYADLASRLGPEAVVATMVPPGVEMALGIACDPQFGPLVLVAAGGVLVEVLHDRRLGLPPLDRTAARRLIDGLRSRAILDGVRGVPAADVEALVDVVARLSLLAAELGDLLDALDVNPLIVRERGCIAVDALVVPRAGSPEV
jgi:acyl-CoA synthetase (NDP forming)